MPDNRKFKGRSQFNLSGLLGAIQGNAMGAEGEALLSGGGGEEEVVTGPRTFDFQTSGSRGPSVITNSPPATNGLSGQYNIGKRPGFWQNLLTEGRAGMNYQDAATRASLSRADAINRMQGLTIEQRNKMGLEQAQHANTLARDRELQIQGILSKLGLPDNAQNRAFIEQSYQLLQQQASLVQPRIGSIQDSTIQTPEGADAVRRNFLATQLAPEFTNLTAQAGINKTNLENDITRIKMPEVTATSRLKTIQDSLSGDVLDNTYDTQFRTGVAKAGYDVQEAEARNRLAPQIIPHVLQKPKFENEYLSSQIDRNLRPPTNKIAEAAKLMDSMKDKKVGSQSATNSPSIKTGDNQVTKPDFFKIGDQIYKFRKSQGTNQGQ